MSTKYQFRITCPECGDTTEPGDTDTATANLIRRFVYCRGCGEFYAVTITLRKLPAQRRPDYAGPRYEPRVTVA